MMLNDFFAKPIEITLGEQTVKFTSLADFEFSLAGRTAIPSKKIISMMRFSTDELKKEAKNIKKIEKRLIGILSKSMEDPDSIHYALRGVEPQSFSQDHSWRIIIDALDKGGKELNPFRRAALVKYMQYLTSRRDIINHLYFAKKNPLKAAASEKGEQDGADVKDTHTLENIDFKSADGREDVLNLDRMPKGESVMLKLKTKKEIRVLLSKHQCRLIGTNTGAKFIDEAGISHELKQGKNSIGRDGKSDIIMNPKLRDVSRTHLIIKMDDANTFYMTDLSVHGTYIPARYLRS